MTQVAIIGGGPGGLLAAYFLTQKCPMDCDNPFIRAEIEQR